MFLGTKRMSEQEMYLGVNCDALPSDVVHAGSASIYYSSSSPGYVWVTCLGSVIRLKLNEDLLSTSVKAEAVRFWNSDGLGLYEPQSDSSIDFGRVSKAKLETLEHKEAKLLLRPFEYILQLDQATGERSRGLRVLGVEP
jgi:hypothetical protein